MDNQEDKYYLIYRNLIFSDRNPRRVRLPDFEKVWFLAILTYEEFNWSVFLIITIFCLFLDFKQVFKIQFLLAWNSTGFSP